MDSQDNHTCVLHDLWPLLGRFTIAEFKSSSRPCRKRDLRRLLRHAMEYSDKHSDVISTREQLSAVLFVPRINRPLREEIEYLGCIMREISSGYTRLEGPILYTTYIVTLDEVADIEDNDFLRVFTSNRRVCDIEARRWMATWFKGDMDMQENELVGYDDAIAVFLDSFLAYLTPDQQIAGRILEKRLGSVALVAHILGLAPEQRLAGLAPEQRLAGLAPEQRLAGLTESERDVLRALLARDEH